MSRMAVLLLALASPVAAPAAEPKTAQEALTSYRAMFKPTSQLGCPQGGGEEEIIVCGRREDEVQPERLPLSIEPEPGERITGEAPSALDELDTGSERCSTVGPNQSCGGGIPILQAIALVAQIAVKLVEPE